MVMIVTMISRSLVVASRGAIVVAVVPRSHLIFPATSAVAGFTAATAMAVAGALLFFFISCHVDSMVVQYWLIPATQHRLI